MEIFRLIIEILVTVVVIRFLSIGVKSDFSGYIRVVIAIVAIPIIIVFLFPVERGWKYKHMQEFKNNFDDYSENNVKYKDVIDSNEIAEFSKNDKIVKTTKMERRSHGIDAYFYLVDPETPISAKFYCDKILAERQEFLVKQGHSIACDILGRNSQAEFLTVVYTYGGEEASYTYTNKWCVSFIEE